MLRGTTHRSHLIAGWAPYAGPMGDERRLESSGDPGHSEDAPAPWAPAPMPDDAARMGLDRNVPDGAWIHFVASLDGSRLSHKLVAWALLLLFAWGLLHQLGNVLRFG